MTILIGTEREFVCEVKEKLCHVALGNGTELKSTEESSNKEAYRFQPSFVGKEIGGTDDTSFQSTTWRTRHL